MEEFLPEFEKYINKNILITPAFGKQPILNDWINIEDMESIKDKFLGNNFGLITGKKSGIVVLDIDATDEEVKELILHVVMDYPTPIMRMGSKLKLPAMFYSYNGQDSARKINYFSLEDGFVKNKVAVELLSNKLCILPPSVHPDGHNYSWMKTPLCDFEIDHLPPFNNEMWNELEKVIGEYNKKFNYSHQGVPRKTTEGRNNKLFDIISAMVGNGDPIEKVLDEVIEYDKINHNPPWMTDASEPHNGDLEKSKKYIINRYNSLLKKEISKDSNFQVVDKSKIEISLAPAITSPESVLDLYEKEFIRMPLPHLRGIGQEMFDYVQETSTSRRSHFIFPAILSVASIAMANRIQFNGILANLYCMIIGHSGVGKNRPLDFIKELLIKSELHDLIGDGSVSGDTAAISWLPIYRERIDIIDEGDNVFQTINAPQSYGRKIADVYASLFSASGKAFTGKPVSKSEKSTKKENVGSCFSPYVSMIMGITFDAFNKSVTENTIEKGFGARILYFSDNEKKLMKMRKQKPIPQKFVDFMRMWHSVEKVNVKDSIDLKNPHLQEFRIRNVKIEKDVERYFENIMEKIFQEIYENDEDTFVSSTINRAPEFIPKLALIDACLTQYTTTHLQIHKENIDWALNAFKAIIHNSAYFLDRNINEGPRKQSMQEIEEFVLRKINGVTMKDISNGFRKIDRRLRKELVEDLLEIGVLHKSEDNIITHAKRLRKV